MGGLDKLPNEIIKSMKNSESSHQIRSIESLEQRVGKTPGPRDLKVIDHLDKNALNWISVSSCMFVSMADHEKSEVRASIGGGAAGFVKTDSNYLHIPLDMMDNHEKIVEGLGWGALFLVPTLKESLRVNGVVESISNQTVSVKVSECYLHCAKAFMRSNFWEEQALSSTVNSPADFCDLASFMLVATSNEQARADLSPKGDPAGKLLCLREDGVWYPDRPGNRRVDSFRNVLSQPNIEIMTLIPGSTQVLRASGTAVLQVNDEIQNYFSVQNKIPTLVVQIDPKEVSLETSLALQRAKLWPAVSPELVFKAADIWRDHVKLSKLKGVQAKIAKAAVSVPGVLQKGLDLDYEKNLY